MIFDILDLRLKEILEKQGIITATDPQTECIPCILSGKNVLLIAPTGLGKTEAAMLPIFHKLITEPHEKISVLYITPLRALNRDMLKRISIYCEALGLKVDVRHGDTTQSARQKQSKEPPDILITTPETLQIMLLGKNLRKILKSVRYVIVDEIHEIADNERGAQLSVALERLRDVTEHEFQRIGLSATIGSPEIVSKFLGGVDRDCEVIYVPVSKSLQITVEDCPVNNKTDFVSSEGRVLSKEVVSMVMYLQEKILQNNFSLLFVNTRDTAEILCSRIKLIDPSFPIGIHHGSLSSEVRVNMEDGLRQGTLRSLICTSSLELGIDLAHIDYIIQYNSPRQVSRLIQRIGRSGHGVGKLSKGVVVGIDEDDLLEAIAIVKQAYEEHLEDIKVREVPFTVLTNQIVSMALQYPDLTEEQIYKILIRAFPFRNLTKEKLHNLLEELNNIGLIIFKDGKIIRRKLSREYFYNNISMIPDEHRYLVIDTTTNKFIGTIDEQYVAMSLETESRFVLKGATWQIFRIDNETHKIYVHEVTGIEEPPSWHGEDIPVPFKVAQEVGKLRRAVRNQEPLLGYVNDTAIESLRKYIAGVDKIATDTEITIERHSTNIIINACFGTKVNQTLGYLLSTLLTAKSGESIGVTTDAYRIVLTNTRFIDVESLKNIIMTFPAEGLKDILMRTMRNTQFAKWKFITVAKKFGILKKELNYEKLNVERLLDSYNNTIIIEELTAKIFHEDFDIEKTAEVLKNVQSGLIKISVSKPTKVGAKALEKHYDTVSPLSNNKEIIDRIKERIDSVNITLCCMNCASSITKHVRDVNEPIVCFSCGSTLVAALRGAPNEHIALIKKVIKSETKLNITESEKIHLKRLLKNANLVNAYKRKAVIVLGAYGVGVDTAVRILMNYHENDYEFYKDILSAEINFVKTRRFWE